jgi:RecA/RadA recombinase
MAKATKVTKKTEASDKDAFDLEIASFLSKNVEGIQIEALEGREQVPFWIPGTFALNWVVSGSFKSKGAMPGTKAIIISGESGRGKSFVADIFLGEQIKRGGIGIKLEVEDAGGIEFTSKIIGSEAIAKKIMIIGPSQDKSGEIKPITIEKLTSILNKLINKQLSIPEENRKEITFVIDSVSQLTSEKEYEDIQKDDDKRDMTPQQKLRALFRNLTQQFRLAKLTVIGIAHKTANIGVMFGPKMVTNAKGSGFGYASSLSLEIVSNKDIEDEKTKIPIAIKMRVRTEKNRFQYKGRQCWLKFNFGRGVEKYFGITEILVQHTIVTSSAKASVMGELGDSNTIKWINPEDQKEHSWKVKDEENFIKNWPKGEDDLFAIWEKQLEDKIIEITGGLVEVEEAEIDEDIDYEDLNLLEESAVA